MSKTWYQTPSFQTNWPVYVKNLISDSFLPNQVASLCQKPDIRLLPSKPIDQSMSKTWYQTPSFQTNWPVGVKNLISRLLPFPTIWTESVSKTWYQTPSFPTNWPESVPKTWYQTPSFPTNWLVSVKNLISDYFLSNQLTSVCQQTDIRLLPS